MKEPALQHKCEWREILPDIPPCSFVPLAACLSVWFVVYLCVFSEAALLRSPSFRWKPNAWIDSWRKHCVRVCLLAQWLNKQENSITARHTARNSQATQASKGGNPSESLGLIVQTQVLGCGAADYRRVHFLIIWMVTLLTLVTFLQLVNPRVNVWPPLENWPTLFANVPLKPAKASTGMEKQPLLHGYTYPCFSPTWVLSKTFPRLSDHSSVPSPATCD